MQSIIDRSCVTNIVTLEITFSSTQREKGYDENKIARIRTSSISNRKIFSKTLTEMCSHRQFFQITQDTKSTIRRLRTLKSYEEQNNCKTELPSCEVHNL